MASDANMARSEPPTAGEHGSKPQNLAATRAAQAAEAGERGQQPVDVVQEVARLARARLQTVVAALEQHASKPARNSMAGVQACKLLYEMACQFKPSETQQSARTAPGQVVDLKLATELLRGARMLEQRERDK